ncbi:MAG: 1,4-alpha-glucan branching protein GlgB [Roseburia sp.]|nr:1,4-alpha-glucan branching protein GlgB [Roseburia sp.]
MAKKLEDYMDWPKIEDLEYAECSRPRDVLGPLEVNGDVLVRGFFPDAVKVSVKAKGKSRSMRMKKMDDAGYFAALLGCKKIPEYTYHVEYENSVMDMCDPYAIDDFVDAMDGVMFENGTHDTIYEKLGAHTGSACGFKGTYFSVWAPNAVSVSVVGDFNEWDGRRNPMKRLDTGIFELFVPGVSEGELYKYEIHGADGKIVLKSDPYGYFCEKRPANASVVWDITSYQWGDTKWLKERSQKNLNEEPVIVYELHPGSFRKPETADEDENAFYNFRELAPMICDYCKQMGYTHVELMPVMEHPYDGSWGYQVTGYYAPTSRYGTPEDFMYFVDVLHQNGIGVFLDWVPAHFPKDEHGLARFDGTCLYEHLDPRQGEHPHWGTLIYNYGRPQVVNFLIANALFWLEKYHVDGLRLDAVASMLYLDYGKQDGEWVANMYGGNENLEAAEFLKQLNKKIKSRKDGTVTIAEESTAWPMITGRIDDGGLGFDFKWNMGWMNDYLEYIRTDPLFRKGRHGMLTFSMVYNYSENFVLVFSHDEVVHGKGSMYGKMPGTAEQKMAELRLTYGYMAAHPGKKLLFMGQDFGQEREWSEARSLDWELLEGQTAAESTSGEIISIKSPHSLLKDYVASLWKFYKEHPALYADDYKPEGFRWISMLDADHSVIAFLRIHEEEILLVVCNFTPVAYEKFRLGVPFSGKYKEIFNSDSIGFGGKGNSNPRLKQSKAVKHDGMEQSIEFLLAPSAVQIFSCREIKSQPKKKKSTNSKKKA